MVVPPVLCCRDAAVNRFSATLLWRRQARDELAPLPVEDGAPSSQAGVTSEDHPARAVGPTNDSTSAAAGDSCIAGFRPSVAVQKSAALSPRVRNADF